VPKSYPVYDGGYHDTLELLKEYVNSLENLQTIGRNGLHRYNNQDHAMLTGMKAVQNALYGESHDLWAVNAEDEYHEEVRDERESVRRTSPRRNDGALPAQPHDANERFSAAQKQATDADEPDSALATTNRAAPG
jgi:hypothetical protein